MDIQYISHQSYACYTCSLETLTSYGCPPSPVSMQDRWDCTIEPHLYTQLSVCLNLIVHLIPCTVPRRIDGTVQPQIPLSILSHCTMQGRLSRCGCCTLTCVCCVCTVYVCVQCVCTVYVCVQCMYVCVCVYVCACMYMYVCVCMCMYCVCVVCIASLSFDYFSNHLKYMTRQGSLGFLIL